MKWGGCFWLSHQRGLGVCTARPGQKPNSAWQTVHREEGFVHSSPGRVLEIEDLENAGDTFSECSSEPNELLHGFLKGNIPRGLVEAVGWDAGSQAISLTAKNPP